ncbi:MAG: rRNA maturation RNase YbeY [Anderseniella sp.]
MIDVDVDEVAWAALSEPEMCVMNAAKATFAKLDHDVSDKAVAIVLACDEDAAELNQQWRGKPGATNVLSFPAAGNIPLQPGEPRHLGDIILAAGVIASEAVTQEKSLADHTSHLVVHGILHILGYDHTDEDEAEAMESLEIAILNDLGIANPYL